MIIRLIVAILIMFVILRLVVGLWPLRPDQLHQELRLAQDQDLPGGVERVFTDQNPSELYDLLVKQITDHPRTKLFAGSVENGHASFVVRSAFWGFPDIVTVQRSTDSVLVRSHLVIGRSDMGVNRARLQGWLEQL